MKNKINIYSLSKKEIKKIEDELRKVINTQGKKALNKFRHRQERPI